jgi:very-short-patch-repair endonuclease
MTLPEGLLWRLLRQRPGGVKFRRQHPAGSYVLDFFCTELLLAIEVDGFAHGIGDRPERDAVRDSWLHDQDIMVVRIPAAEILQDENTVVEHIANICAQRIPLHRPADGPPSRSGEEL